MRRSSQQELYTVNVNRLELSFREVQLIGNPSSIPLSLNVFKSYLEACEDDMTGSVREQYRNHKTYSRVYGWKDWCWLSEGKFTKSLKTILIIMRYRSVY